MDRERYQKVREILLAALDAHERERDLVVEQRCGDDEALRAEVLALLHQETRGAIRDPSPPKVGDHTPRRIGPYRVEEILGVGGMGAVYRAQQTEPIRREVALKLIRGGLASEHAVARFEIERQVLASLSHPNIAQVYDAGSTDDGLPYFAMELVEGVPITEYCSVKKLDTRARVKLFLEVCRAVQHAHNKGVIHRDLKPSNIIVTERQDRSVPKIIDFGIAKALDVGDDYVTLATREGQLVGTLEYMSPEQAGGGSAAADTRSDVYALGVVLYQLIAERMPYELRGLSAIEAVQLLVGGTPSRLTFASTGAGARRDLEIIVMKALEKEPGRRYESPAALAADLERFLDGEPITARAPSATYQLKRLVTRHRVVFGFTAVLVVALAAFGIGMSVLYARQEAARKAAVEEAAKAKEIGDYLGRMIGSVNVLEDGRDMTVAELLEKVSNNVDDEVSHPDARVAVRTAIAFGYYSLDRWAEAREQYDAALEILRNEEGPPSAELLEVMDGIVATSYYIGDYDRAIETSDELVRLRSTYTPDSEGLGITLNNLARLLIFNWRFDEAVSAEQRSVAAFERADQVGSGDYLVSVDGIAIAYEDAGNFERALEARRESVALRLQYLGEDNMWTFGARTAVAGCLYLLGRYAEADSICRSLRANPPSKDFNPLELDRCESHIRFALGQEEEGISLMRRSLAGREAWAGVDVPRNFPFHADLALLLLEAGDAGEALRVSTRALELASRSPRRDHPNAATVLSLHGACLAANGRPAEAESVLREAIAVFEAYGVGDHWQAVMARIRLGQTLATAGRWSEASSLFEAARPSLGRLPFGTRLRAVRAIADLYRENGDPETADTYMEELAVLSSPQETASR